MNTKTFFLLVSLFLSCTSLMAQEAQKSDLHKRADASDPKENIAQTRSLYIHAFNDYANRSDVKQGVECAVKAASLYHKENFYKEAFDLLRRADQVVNESQKPSNEKAAAHYQCTNERLQMYIKLRKSDSAKEQLNILSSLASQTGDESINNDLLYTKALYYYTFGMNAQGNAVFQEMANKLTASKEYDKVDEVYKSLITNARRSNNANFVAQSYNNYLAWKDSIADLKLADETGVLKKQIADHEASIADKDSSLTARMAFIVGLGILAAALAAALVVGAFVLMRYILLTRRQKDIIRLANDSNALKSQFISNISAQLAPSFRKLDTSNPEVKALLAFTDHIQLLSDVERTVDEKVELEDTQIQPFCEELMDQIRPLVKDGVNLTVNAQKMTFSLNREYVSHIISHLLHNAADFTPADGTICLDVKKRSAHTYQFIVTDSGENIPEERREEVFKPFCEIHDLTNGDGLGLPICKQMAIKMNGDLVIDPDYVRGTRFILELHV